MRTQHLHPFHPVALLQKDNIHAVFQKNGLVTWNAVLMAIKRFYFKTGWIA